MCRKSTFIRKISALFCFVLLSVLPAASFASAENSGSSVIYVAGNDDLYPVEYYDFSSKQYLGMMPDIYRLISEQTGYTFEYIHAGNINDQERTAKNGQAEIISAYPDGEVDPQYLQHPIPVTSIKSGEEEKTINIAFTEIASEKLIADITQALNSISDNQKLTLLLSHTESKRHGGEYLMWIYILSGILLLFLAAAVILSLFWFRRKKKNSIDVMLDPEYGIGNDQYYVYCFQNLISDKSKALYYVAYIAFDEKGFRQKFGDEDCRDVQRYAAEFLNRQTAANEYLAAIGDGVYAFVYQAANKAAAEERIVNV